MNRRDVLRLAGAVTALGMPARGFAQISGPGPIMSAVSAYMSAASARDLPAEIAEHAKCHLLDTLASMISGSELPPGQAAERYIRERGAKGAATIAGFAMTASTTDAALANGAYSNTENDNGKVFSFYRAGNDGKVLVILNLSGELQKANFTDGYKKYTTLFGNNTIHKKTIELKPYEIAVFEVK